MQQIFSAFKLISKIWTSSLFFSFRLFYFSTRFISVLTLKSSAIHWLTCFRVSSGLSLVLFWWMLWMLVTVHKLWHEPHASPITTSGVIFMERIFSVSKEWVRSWSHGFLITYHKTFTKKLFRGPSRKTEEKEKKKQSRIGLTKLFALRKRNKLEWQLQSFLRFTQTQLRVLTNWMNIGVMKNWFIFASFGFIFWWDCNVFMSHSIC